MKNSLLKWYMFAFLFLGNLMMFAQVNPDSSEACTGPDCPPLENDDAPIDSKLIYLGIVAIIFAYVYFKKNSEKRVTA